MAKSQAIVLDSWAVLAYFQDEPAAEAIQEILTDAQAARTPLLMSVINAGEVWYTYFRRSSEKTANERIEQLRLAGVAFVGVDWPLAQVAGQFKGKHAIAYGDCYAVALAKRENARLVTGDPELKQLEDEVEITWV